MHLITRISYNSTGWQRPTADASKLEEEETFNSLHLFGYEDWLFRGEWQVDGWRYAFLQGANVKESKYLKDGPVNVTLYTIPGENQRRWVADIQELESLSTIERSEAQEVFRQQGWLHQMEEEVRAVGGDPRKIIDSDYSGHFLNIRFRAENLHMLPPGTALPKGAWPKAYYYQFQEIGQPQEDALAQLFPQLVGGRAEPLPDGPVYRRGAGAVLISPEHRRMQAKLLERLQHAYGHDRVRIEVGGIDVVAETDEEVRLYEIKTHAKPQSVIREALGQILEYAYHPPRQYNRPLRLVIVGRVKLNPNEQAYLNGLVQKFQLPIEYEVVSL